MKFGAFKEFKAGIGATIEDVRDYLSKELANVIRELRTGLDRLSLTDNFEAFEVELTIPSGGTDYPIRNQLRGGVIPTRWIVVRTDQYGLSVCDGDTEWTTNFLYLKNTAASAATLTVIFMK